MTPLIITAALVAALIACVLCYMAGRARGHMQGWKENSEWQRIIAEHGLRAEQTVPMARMQTKAVPHSAVGGGDQ